MTVTAYEFDTAYKARRTSDHITDVVRTAVNVLVHWHDRRRALRQLYQVHPRTLKDIGMNRSEVNSIVYGGSSGRRRA